MNPVPLLPHALERASARLAAWCDHVAAVLVAIFTFVVATAVFYRYILVDPLGWSDEFARYTMVAMVFIAAAPAFRRGEAIAVDVLLNLIPSRRVAAALAFMAHLMVAVFMVLLIVHGIRLALATAGQTTPSLSLPRGMAYALVPLGAALMLTQVLSLAAGRLGAALAPAEPAPETA